MTAADLQGFDPQFKDLDDYIRVITARIWEGREIDRIRDWYGDDCAVITPGGTTSGVDAVVRGTLVSSPTWWLGHSLGGIVALQLAARHPQAVAGLLLLAANARAAPAAGSARRAAQRDLAQRHGLRALAHDKLGAGYGLPTGDALVESLADQAEAVGMQRFDHQLAYASQRPDRARTGSWIEVPVLALSAADDLLCPPAQSDELASLTVPGAPSRHDCLHGAGHLFPMQRPTWVADRLCSFLNHVHRRER